MDHSASFSISRLLSGAAVAALATVSAPAAFAANGPCAASSGDVTLNQVMMVEAGVARSYAVNLAAGQGVIVDLVNPEQGAGDAATAAADAAMAAGGEHDHSAMAAADGSAMAEKVRICGASGAQLAPGRASVFDEEGGSGETSATTDGTRLRFVAPSSGRYMIELGEISGRRELLVRNRSIEAAGETAIMPLTVGGTANGSVAPNAPKIYSFSGTAGQWVEIKSRAEELDTAIRLAGPTSDGSMEVLGYIDDTEGLNPIMKRRLPVTGEYLVQVTSVVGGSGDFTISLDRTAAPPPPPPAAMLREGQTINGRLTSTDEFRTFTFDGKAGESYSLELNAKYDAWIKLGLINPLEASGSETETDGGFTMLRSADDNLEGTEKLNFTMARDGRLNVEVRTYGLPESEADYGFTLKLNKR